MIQSSTEIKLVPPLYSELSVLTRTFLRWLNFKSVGKDLQRTQRSNSLALISIRFIPPSSTTARVFGATFGTTRFVHGVMSADEHFTVKIYHLRLLHFKCFKTEPLIN